MIDSQEIKQKAVEFGIQPTDVEKDYVYGWILNELYSQSPLGSKLILKGGNGCRKGYLPNTRFSKDLDFSIQDEAIDLGFLHDELNKVCSNVTEKTGIKFELDKTVVRPKNVPIPNLNAIEGRAYFHGFNGEESIILKAQVDVTQFDRIYLPIQDKQLIHPYSDSGRLAASIKCQKLEEIIASKLDTLLHRRKAADMFDLLYSILFNSDYQVNKTEVITTFIKKTIYESNPAIVKAQLVNVPLDEYQPIWSTIVAPVKSLFGFDIVVANFASLLDDLFNLVPVATPAFGGIVGGRGFNVGGFGGLSYFPSKLRNTIIRSGQTRTLVELTYDGYRRLVEPYAIEYKTRKSDGRGQEYFWGYDTTGGKSGKQSIKQFICDKIESANPTSQFFTPQWPIEL